jgi:alpha-1,6-mannosyltransferase
MFAFGITTLALRYILPEALAVEECARRSRLFLCLVTVAGIIFRSELVLFLATHTIFLYAAGRINIRRDIIPAGAAGLLIGLTITVAIDSFFWQQFPLWPELTSFMFNVMSGQASAWGTQPWYFYFTNAIPRLLLNPLTYCIGIPFSLLQPSSQRPAVFLLVPSLAYVAVYSLQPHKEWRFIVYVIPPLTAAAALGTSYIWTHRNKSLFYRFLSLAIVLSTALSFLVSTFILLPASSTNYPGAHALHILHKRADGSEPAISVHLGNLACQTGVTRFLQLQLPLQASSADGLVVSPGRGRSLWSYDKTGDESLKSTSEFWDRFDYVLAEDELDIVSRVTGPSRWEIFDVANGFGGIRVLPPGEKGTGTVERDLLAALLGNRGAQLWDRGKDLARRYVTRGWWVEMKVEPKIKILKRV